MTTRPPSFESDERDGTDGPTDALDSVDELEALRASARLVASRLPAAPTYTVDRLTRELRTINRAIAEREAQRATGPAALDERPAADVIEARERLVRAVVVAGADPDAAVAAAVEALPVSGALVADLRSKRGLRRIALAAARDAA